MLMPLSLEWLWTSEEGGEWGRVEGVTTQECAWPLSPEIAMMYRQSELACVSLPANNQGDASV